MREKIAVIGAGISGITAAHVLSRNHDVTLFEKNEKLGGHTNTRIIEDSIDAGVAVDTGFIVCNTKNYPNFYKLLSQLEVQLQNSDMSFGFYCEKTNLQYMGPALKDFMLTPHNLFKPQFFSMLLEQRRFNSKVLKDLEAGVLNEQPLKDYLKELKISQYFIDHYLIPMIAAIWSSPNTEALDFPMATFATFFANHGMLELSKRPQWQTVVGGSHQYLKAFENKFTGKIVLNSLITRVSRQAQNAIITFRDASSETFDKIIFATHADEALSLLKDPSPEETRLLGNWRYSRNQATLHRDKKILNGKKKFWASWNYCRRNNQPQEAPVSITYYMNRLQNLSTVHDYFVTLNGDHLIDPAAVIYKKEYTHPIYSTDSVATQSKLQAINGNQNTYYCGAYLGYGFHEDGVKSALEVTKHFGLNI